jgi:hypothetical protein
VLPLPANFEPLAALSAGALLKSALLTALLWLGAFGARWLVLRALKVRGMPLEQYRRVVGTTRSIIVVVLLVGTAALWFDELKVFALSLAAQL